MAFFKVTDITKRIAWVNEDFVAFAVPVHNDESDAICHLVMQNGFTLPVLKLPPEKLEWGRSE